MRVVATGAALLAALVASSASWACDSDEQCKGDRVCENGTCVAPKPKKPKKPVEEDASEVEPEKPRKKPKKADDGPSSEESAPPKKEAGAGETPEGAPLPESSAWSGVKAPVNFMVGVLVGDSFRTNKENVLFGTALGLDIAFISGNGFVAATLVEHLSNSKSESRDDGLGGRFTVSGEGRSSYYTLNVGYDVPLGRDFNFRFRGGLGIIHRHVRATASSSTFPSQTSEKSGLDICLDPAIGLISRWIGRSWYTGVHFGPLFVLSGEEGFGVGAWNLYGTIGHVF
jgi:hypothetical protein